MNEDTIACLNCDFAQILMRTMHGVSELQSGNLAPASFFKYLACLGRLEINAFIFGRIFTLGKDLDRTGQAYFLACHEHLHARMVLKSSLQEVTLAVLALALIDLFCFPFFVFLGHLKFFSDVHSGVNFTFTLQGNIVANIDPIGIGLGGSEHHRNRPKSTVGKKHIFTNSLPVSLGHKTIQGTEAADTHHNQVAFCLGRDWNLLKPSGPFLLIL